VQSKGKISHNAMLLKFNRRFANNFSFANSYTYGRTYDYASDNDGTVTFLNVYDFEYDWGFAQYDVRHTFSSNWIYQLPFAPDKAWGGWQVSGIFYLRSGLPFSITQTQGVQSTGTGNRPNQVCDGSLSDRTIDRWFDTSCWTAVPDPTGTYGNTGRNTQRGPGQFNIDASLIKLTRIGRVETEFRIEAFNLLNHPQFVNPNGTLGNAAFGTISQMLSNPACSLCGTTERQIQIGVKAKF
jgi:hypothetical protein